MGKLSFAIYSWATTILFAVLIYWIATIPNFEVSNDLTNEVVKVLFRMILYAFLFVLIYRSFIATFRGSVQRLSHWRSKGEASEDAEFVLIIETLLVIIGVMGSILFAIFEEYVQSTIPGRAGEIKDILISVMAALLAALVVYSIPVVGELEMAIKHYYIRAKKKLGSR
jgi:hypothetical protein